MAKKSTPKRESEELALLYDISLKLEENLDLSTVAGPILKAMAERMGMLHGTLTLLNRQTGEISIEAAHGLSKSQVEKGRYHEGEGVTGKVVKNARSAVVPKVSEEPLFLNKTGARRNLRKKDISFLCVPIKVGPEVVGTLSADRLFSEDVSYEEDVRLMTIIASLIAQAVKLRQTVQEERQRLLEENQRLQDRLKERYRPDNMIGNSKAMQEVYNHIRQVSASDSTVLIRGETGTGKELVAHAIHYGSARASCPYVKVNCAALPEGVLESELFGHVKGAFTGALQDKKGRFEMANGGTIFLDEIGDLPAQAQVKLLRVLQEREFERVGGTDTIKVDVRIITATNRNLEKLTEDGTFRQDLYYRLNVFPIHLPPLRERKSDILLLADFFTQRYAQMLGKDVRRISTPAIDMMMAYHWPGNVRELENCLERAVLLTDDHVIHGHHLPPTLQTAEQSNTVLTGTLQATLDNVEAEIILETLKRCAGNMRKAAQDLGITERIMGLRVLKHNINPRRFRKSYKG